MNDKKGPGAKIAYSRIQTRKCDKLFRIKNMHHLIRVLVFDAYFSVIFLHLPLTQYPSLHLSAE
jgi:hypothetical protein